MDRIDDHFLLGPLGSFPLGRKIFRGNKNTVIAVSFNDSGRVLDLDGFLLGSFQVWRLLMAGGALLVTALLLPLWRVPSNEQRRLKQAA